MEEYGTNIMPCYETSATKEKKTSSNVASEGEVEPSVELTQHDTIQDISVQIYTAKLYKDKKELRELRAKERLLLMKEIDYLKNKEASAIHQQQKKVKSPTITVDKVDKIQKDNEGPKKPGRLASIPQSI